MSPDLLRVDESPEVRAGFVVPAILFAVTLAAYAASVSNHLTGDSTWYAHDILMPREQFFHPHHLLYNPLMRGLVLLFSPLLGGPEAKILFLQMVNIGISALASAAFGVVAMRMGAGATSAGIITLMLGLSGSFYFFSSQIEVYGLTSLFLCVSLMGLIRVEETPRSRFLIAGGYAGALLFHQTAIFLGAPILMCGLMRHRGDRGRLIRRLAVTLVLPLAVVGLTYVAISLHLGHRDPASFWQWVTMHVQWGYWGKGTLSAGTLRPAFSNFLKAVMVVPPGTSRWFPVFFGSICLFILARVRAAGRGAFRSPFLIVVLLVWMAMLAGFSTWWDAQGAEFWGMVLVPAYLALSLVAPAAKERRAMDPPRILAGVCLALSLAMVVASAVAQHRMNMQPNDIREAARAAPRVARDGDLIWAASTDRSTYYRIYLAGRPVIVLAINVKPARQAGGRSTPATFTRTLIDVLDTEVRAVESRGGRCFVDRWVLEGSISTTRLTADLNLEEFMSALRSRFRLTPAAAEREPLFYELHPL